VGRNYILKKIISVIMVLALMISLSACGNSTKTGLKTEDYENNKKEENILDLVDEQLQGTWISYDSENVYSKWSFHNGQYVVDTYLNGEKLDNSTVGTYSIGTDAIHTVTIDQKNNVEGSISYEYTDGVLVLKGATGTIEKE
jgi:hypothetical protein